jgi:hypothetical protein
MLDIREAVKRGIKSAIGEVIKGGPGSGNFGHAGRPGQIGGSASGEGSATPRGGREFWGFNPMMSGEGHGTAKKLFGEGKYKLTGDHEYTFKTSASGESDVGRVSQAENKLTKLFSVFTKEGFKQTRHDLLPRGNDSYEHVKEKAGRISTLIEQTKNKVNITSVFNHIAGKK